MRNVFTAHPRRSIGCPFWMFVLPLLAIAMLTLPRPARAEAPEPSPYPVSWDLTFTHSIPKRIAVQAPGEEAPRAYWYVTYKVVNNTDKEHPFYPVFEMMTKDGIVTRSDNNIPHAVFDEIKHRENNKFLEDANHISGTINVGEDQAKEGVAIWAETTPRMGTFHIYISGLSGETATVKGPDNKDVTVYKTLELTYQILGDEEFPNENEVTPKGEKWIMR